MVRNLSSCNAALCVQCVSFSLFLFLSSFKVIYDNDLTEAFVRTLELLLDPTDFNAKHSKEIYIALEKRYVFTLTDLDTAAPCYEHFLHCIENVRKEKKWKFESIPIDFDQYFDYERVKELVLLKISL